MAEIKEKFCSDCKHDDKTINEYPCCECCNAYLSKFEPKTNFDRIKEMSVGEMADFICDIYADNDHSPQIRVGGKWMFDTDVEEWLESEVQNNG